MLDPETNEILDIHGKGNEAIRILVTDGENNVQVYPKDDLINMLIASVNVRDLKLYQQLTSKDAFRDALERSIKEKEELAMRGVEGQAEIKRKTPISDIIFSWQGILMIVCLIAFFIVLGYSQGWLGGAEDIPVQAPSIE